MDFQPGEPFERSRLAELENLLEAHPEQVGWTKAQLCAHLREWRQAEASRPASSALQTLYRERWGEPPAPCSSSWCEVCGGPVSGGGPTCESCPGQGF